MPGNRTSVGETKEIQNGNVSVEHIVFSKKIALFVLFSFSGKGASDFLAAAEYKKKRLERKYPKAEVLVIDGFKLIKEFKKKWVELYNELTAETTQYQLWEVHYFGHGSHDCLFLDDPGVNLQFIEEEQFPILPWHPNKGIFVLHSCRGAAYEDYISENHITDKICLAQRISKLQNTRCLGQVVYANFCALPSRYIYIYAGVRGKVLTDEEKEAEMKYRSDPIINQAATVLGADKSLWGYALLTGNTGKKILNQKKEYETIMARLKKPLYPKYQIYYDVEILSSRNQIMPCRVFNKGVLEQERIVKLNEFNNNDLDFI